MAAPNLPTDIIDRLRALERKVDDLSGRVNIRPALNTIVGGSMTVKDGGQLVVESPDNHDLINIGRLYPDVDGQPQYGAIIRRMDGSMAIAVYNASGTGKQPVYVYDLNGHAILADDTAQAGGGLAIPWLTFPTPRAVNNTLWPSTTSTTFVDLETSKGPLHHPRMRIMVASNGVGQLRVQVNGTTVITTGSMANPSLDDYFTVPSWSYNGPQIKTVTLQALATTGTIRATTQALYGVQS